jgi:Flp pilus assembly protein TadD
MPRLTSASLIGLLALLAAGCEQLQPPDEGLPAWALENRPPADPANVIDAANLNELMLTVADPNQAVEYFRQALGREPDRLEFRRGYAKSLARAGKQAEASLVYRQLVADGLASTEDRLSYAETLAHANAWDEVAAQLAIIPEMPDSYRVAMLRAMMADQRSDWATADRYYEQARRLTPRPAGVLNNWGVSRMSRGDLPGAETTLMEAVSFDPRMFAAKNNLILARGLQGKFELPVVPMTETERAQLLHNLAVIALRKGKTDTARNLLVQAIEVSPSHFEAAVAKLEALGTKVN